MAQYAWPRVFLAMLHREMRDRGEDIYSTLWTLLLPVFLVSAAAFALGPPSNDIQAATGAWFLIYLASTAVLDTLLGREQQQATGFALLWSDAFLLFLAKAVASLVLLTVLELCVFPVLFAAWFGGALPPAWPFLTLVLSTNLYLSAVTVFIGIVSLQARNRSTVFALMGLPLMLPVLLMAGKALGDMLLGISVTAPILAMLALTGAVVTITNAILKEVWWL